MLPFGLNCAPWVFTKLMKPVVTYLRGLGFTTVVYLDDWLLIGKNYSECKENVEVTVTLPNNLGFLINQKKSVFIPTTKCKYLGLEIDSERMELSLPQEIRKNVSGIKRI